MQYLWHGMIILQLGLLNVDYRRQGIAWELVRACQIFSKEQGCTEFARDFELDNEESLQFHLKMGFEEAKNRGFI